MGGINPIIRPAGGGLLFSSGQPLSVSGDSTLFPLGYQTWLGLGEEMGGISGAGVSGSSIGIGALIPISGLLQSGEQGMSPGIVPQQTSQHLSQWFATSMSSFNQLPTYQEAAEATGAVGQALGSKLPVPQSCAMQNQQSASLDSGYMIGAGASGGEPAHTVNRKQQSRPERIRIVYTKEQLRSLEEEFGKNRFLTPEVRQYLANSLTISEKQVKIWYINRRQKDRRQKTKHQQEIEMSQNAVLKKEGNDEVFDSD
jgi:hypothetical protein